MELKWEDRSARKSSSTTRRSTAFFDSYSLEEAAVKAGRNKREKMNGRANIARSPVCRVCEWEERARGRRGAGEGCNSRVSRMKKRKNGGGRTRWLMADFASLYRACPFVPAFRKTAARRAPGSDQRSHGINLLFSPACPASLLHLLFRPPPRRNEAIIIRIFLQNHDDTISTFLLWNILPFPSRNIEISPPRFLRLRLPSFRYLFGKYFFK